MNKVGRRIQILEMKDEQSGERIQILEAIQCVCVAAPQNETLCCSYLTDNCLKHIVQSSALEIYISVYTHQSIELSLSLKSLELNLRLPVSLVSSHQHNY